MPVAASRPEADIGTVVEGIEIGVETLGGLKVGANIQRVFFALLLQQTFAFCQRRTQKWIAVRGQYNFVRLEIESNGYHVLSGNVESVDYAIGDVLFLHGLNHAWNDERTGGVVT